GNLRRQVDNVAGERPRYAGDGAALRLRQFRLAEREHVDVVAGDRVVRGHAQRVARACRLDQVRRDDDDEVGFFLAVLRAAQERADHRHVADPAKLFQIGVAGVLQQPGHGEALAVAQLDRRVGTTHDKAGNLDGADLHHVGGIELAYLG